MSKLFRSARRVGKSATKFQFELTVQELQYNPRDPIEGSRLSVAWSRGPKVAVTREARARNGNCLFRETLTILATLYRDAKTNKFEEKQSKIIIQQSSDSPFKTKSKIMGQATLDLAEFAKPGAQADLIRLTLQKSLIADGLMLVSLVAHALTDEVSGDAHSESSFAVSSVIGGHHDEQDLSGFDDPNHHPPDFDVKKDLDAQRRRAEELEQQVRRLELEKTILAEKTKTTVEAANFKVQQLEEALNKAMTKEKEPVLEKEPVSGKAEILQKQINKLKEKLSSFENREKDLNDELEAAAEKIQTLEDQVDKLQREKTVLSNQTAMSPAQTKTEVDESLLVDYRAKIEKQLAEIESLKAQVKSITEEKQTLADRVKEVERELKQLNIELDSLRQGKERDTKQIEKLNQDLAAAQHRIDELNQDKNELEDRIKSVESEHSFYKDASEHLEATDTETAGRLAHLEDELTKITRDLNSAVSEKERLQTQLETVQAELKELKSENEHLKSEVKVMENKVRAAEKEVHDSKNEIGRFKGQASPSALQNEIHRLEAELRNAEKQINETKMDRDRSWSQARVTIEESESMYRAQSERAAEEMAELEKKLRTTEKEFKDLKADTHKEKTQFSLMTLKMSRLEDDLKQALQRETEAKAEKDKVLVQLRQLQQDKDAEINSKVTDNNDETKALRLRVSDLEDELLDAKDEIDKLRDQIEDLEKKEDLEISDDETETERGSDAHMRGRSSIVSVIETRGVSQEDYDKVIKELSDLKTELRRQKRESDEMIRDLMKEKDEALEDLREAREESESRANRLSTTGDEEDQDIVSLLRRENDELKIDVAELQNQIQSAKASWGEINRVLMAQVSDAEQQLVEMKIRFAESETERGELSKKLHDVNEKMVKLREDKLVIAQRMTQLEVELAKTRGPSIIRPEKPEKAKKGKK
eukprot:GILJ01004282.1.p1 GENE.GILJ01004282.1~~GILJ01004282.1.p1  ORF type:complete len:935 (-),score=247.18 GILJ01004282.1:108-2912(-)